MFCHLISCAHEYIREILPVLTQLAADHVEYDSTSTLENK